MNFEMHWRQARSALSSRLPTSRTWNDRKIERTFRTWHWHNLSLLDTKAPRLLLSLPRCKLLPFCHLVRRGSTANQQIRRTRNPGLPLHIERKALVSFPAGLGLEPVQLLNVPKVRQRHRNVEKKMVGRVPNCTFSLESTGAGNLGLGLTKTINHDKSLTKSWKFPVSGHCVFILRFCAWKPWWMALVSQAGRMES